MTEEPRRLGPGICHAGAWLLAALLVSCGGQGRETAPLAISGRVLDADGRRVTDASVVVRARGTGATGWLAPSDLIFIRLDHEVRDHSWDTIPSAHVDDDGWFCVEVPGAGRYELAAESATHALAPSGEVEVVAELVPPLVELRVGAALIWIEGTARDEHGAPIDSAEVQAWPLDDGAAAALVRAPTLTNADGTFRVPAVAKGRHQLMFFHNRMTLVGPICSAPTQDLRVMFTDAQFAGGTIDVELGDWHGRPLQDGRVWLQQRSGEARRRSGYPVVDGRVHIDKLPLDAEVWLVFRGAKPATDSAYAPCVAEPFAIGREHTLRFDVQPWSLVPVRVVDADGAPLPAAKVVVEDPFHLLDAEDLGVRDDGGGKWTLSLPQRRLRLKAFCAGFDSADLHATFEPGRNDEHVLRLTRR